MNALTCLHPTSLPEHPAAHALAPLQEANRQARLAKLLCAFLQHLLDCGQEGVVPAVYADVQAFCIAWSRLREAAALFRRLKALEGGLPEEEGEEEAALESPGSSGLRKGG